MKRFVKNSAAQRKDRGEEEYESRSSSIYTIMLRYSILITPSHGICSTATSTHFRIYAIGPYAFRGL